MGRVVLLTLLALILGGSPQGSAYAKQHDAQTNQRRPDAKILPLTNAIDPAQPPEYYQPCKGQRDDGNSDLCAQWTSAHAGSEAAYWAKWGSLFGLVSIIGLVLTWFETRRTATAAIAAVKESRRANEAQLRPYLYIEKVEPEQLEAGSNFIRLHLKNFGQTPARKIRIRHGIAQCAPGEIFVALPDDGVELPRDVPPQHTQKAKLEMPQWVVDLIPQVLCWNRVIVVTLFISYEVSEDACDCERAVIVFDGRSGPRAYTPKKDGPREMA